VFSSMFGFANAGQLGAAPLVVASYAYAAARFGDAVKAVGRPVLLNNQPVTIAGVTGAGGGGTRAGFPGVHEFHRLEREGTRRSSAVLNYAGGGARSVVGGRAGGGLGTGAARGAGGADESLAGGLRIDSKRAPAHKFMKPDGSGAMWRGHSCQRHIAPVAIIGGGGLNGG